MAEDLTGINNLLKGGVFQAKSGSIVDLSLATVKLPISVMKGPQGLPGIQGPQGLQGIQGVAGSGGGGTTSYTIRTSNFTSIAGDHSAVNTTSGAITATLPASPNPGDYVVYSDAKGTWGTHSFTISPNGGKIASSTSNIVCSTNNALIIYVYIDSSYGWS